MKPPNFAQEDFIDLKERKKGVVSFGEGYWRKREDSSDWSSRTEFVDRLDFVQQNIPPRGRMQDSNGPRTCRCCSIKQVQGDYFDWFYGDFCWPMDYGHYLKEHKRLPSRIFYNYVMIKSKKFGYKKTVQPTCQQWLVLFVFFVITIAPLCLCANVVSKMTTESDPLVVLNQGLMNKRLFELEWKMAAMQTSLADLHKYMKDVFIAIGTEGLVQKQLFQLESSISTMNSSLADSNERLKPSDRSDETLCSEFGDFEIDSLRSHLWIFFVDFVSYLLLFCVDPKVFLFFLFLVHIMIANRWDLQVFIFPKKNSPIKWEFFLPFFSSTMKSLFFSGDRFGSFLDEQRSLSPPLLFKGSSSDDNRDSNSRMLSTVLLDSSPADRHRSISLDPSSFFW